MTSDLFLAILAMDAYNRTGGDVETVGLAVQGGSIGDATLGPPRGDNASGFFAQSYIWKGKTVISYRGTDQIFTGNGVGGDLVNGWVTGGGAYNSAQARLAAQFYLSLNHGIPSSNPNIILTGHSLGGGLAGFVGSIYGDSATIFDNMPFELAAQRLYNKVTEQPRYDPNGIFLGDSIADPVALQLFYGGTTPQPPMFAGLHGWYVVGEPLSALRLLQSTPTTGLAAGDALTLFQRHSMALLVTLLYADPSSGTNVDQNWTAVRNSLLPQLFNNTIANAIGAGKAAGTDTPAGKMLTEIAYSAIGSGAMPFGNTAIQSLFHDADALGTIQSAGQFTGLLSSQLTGTALSPAGGLAEIAVQFAAQQAADANAAFGDETSSGIVDPSLKNGAFTLDGPTLKVDLDPRKWLTSFQLAEQQSDKKTTAVLGLGDFFDALLTNITPRLSLADPTYSWIANNLAGFSDPLRKQLNEITQVDVALNGGDLSATGLPGARGGSPGGAMLIGGDGKGSLTGSDKGNDIIVGGSTVKAGDGNDIILAGGPATETITLGQGKNQILADDGGMNVTLTYADGATGAPGTGTGGSGATGGAPGDASAGSDLIIGPGAGGGTYTFTDADKASFTVVWDGAGNNTFNIKTSSGSSSAVNIVELDMSGVSGDKLTRLDMGKLQDYVDQKYGLSKSDATIVILNPSSSDKITYNDKPVETPQSTLSFRFWSNNDFAGTSKNPNVVADEAGGWFEIAPDIKHPLEYMTSAKEEAYIKAAYDSVSWWDFAKFFLGADLILPSIWEPQLQSYMATGINPLAAFVAVGASLDIQDFTRTHEMVTNTWVEDSRTSKGYALASSNFEFNLALTNASTRELSLLPIIRKITNIGGESDPTSPLEQHFASGFTSYFDVTAGNMLNLINYNFGDFGIGTPPNGVGFVSTEKETEYEVLQGWAKGNAFSRGPGFATLIFGTSPEQLGAVINNFNPNNPPSQLYDPSVMDQSHARPTLNLDDYLSGASSNDPTNVSVAFFAANQALLDGQFAGFTVLDTAANVSSALDALNEDTKLTGITLTDSGTPTLTLAAAQAFGDTTALGEITNTSYHIAIADTTANVSQDIDALNADQTVTSIYLTDAGTASLTLTAMQALLDSSALAKISNTGYTIAVSDAAQNISFAVDALNSDSAVSSITLTDSGTPTLSLTVAQALGDTRVLGEITNATYGINVEDSVADILANAAALSADAHVTGAVVVDTAANVLDNAEALNADAQVTSITVVDSVANIFANLSALHADAKVTSLVVIDTAANVLANASALASVAEITSIGVVDTAANVSANIDGLNADASLSSIMLTDGGTPTVTLTAAQAVNDTRALAQIANVNYAIDVVDTAAAVNANIDALSQVAALAKITLTDAGSPTLTLTAAQAVNDAAAIGMIASTAQVVVADTAADVVAHLDALNAEATISGIVLTDAGTPTLTLTVAQALGDATALGKIENANVQTVVFDTAADVSANFAALNADAALSSIVLTDSGTPILVLTVAQAINDTGLLAKVSNSDYAIAVFDSVANILANAGSLGANARISPITAIDSVANILANSAALAAAGCSLQIVADSAADVAANIDAIKTDALIRAISLTDSGTPTLSLTVAQTIGDAAALERIVNATFAVDIVDSAANVSAAINSLAANGVISAVTLTDPGTPTLSLNVAKLLGDGSFLAKITNAGYAVNVTDTAAVVAAHLDALNINAALGAITLTDPGTPVLNLSAAQALGDTNALGLITNADYTIAVTDTVANFLADEAALAADAAVSSISIVDNAANVLAAQASLAGNPKLSSVTVVDTAANMLAAASALAGMPIFTTLDVVDSAANVAANFDALNADFSIARITLSDASPILTLTAAQAATDYSARFKISNPSYAIAVVDSAANVSAYLDQLEFNSNVTSITLTDAGTPVLDLSSNSLGADSDALSKITNPAYTISLVGAANVPVATFVADHAILDAVPGGFEISDLAATVGGSIDALNADPNLTAITLYGGYGGIGSTLVLSAAQAVSDTRALGLITNPQGSISVTDSVANILADYDALAANSEISSVIVQDTAANVLANAAAVNGDSAITSISIVDTAADVASNESALAVLTKPIIVTVKDTAADVSAQIDRLNGNPYLSSYPSAIVLTDAGTPTLTLTAAQAINDSNALNAIAIGSPLGAAGFAIAITDTAVDISQHLDALGQVSQISSVSLTDTSHLALTLDVAEALNDANVVSAITNASCDVAVVDTAANIESNLDGLNADANISSITVQGGGAPVITVTAAQAAQDAPALGKLANATVDIVNTDNISVAEFLSEQPAIDSIGATFSILDTAANVDSNLAVLTADPTLLSAITLTDSGVPTLTLTAAQTLTLQNAVTLGTVVNPSYAIEITDTAAAISTDFAALSAVPQISSITLSDLGVPTLSLTVAQLAHSALFGKITNASYNLSINDTASNIANDLDSLNTDSQVGSIVVNDSDRAYMDLTVAQVLGDTVALGKIANATYSIAVIDSADNIAANIDALSANDHIVQVASHDPIPLTVAKAMENDSLLRNGSISFNNSGVLPVPVAIVDTATNVAAVLGSLNRDAGIVSITLTDSGTPVLNLTAAQAASDTTALGEIVGPYTINIVQGPAAVSVADLLANQATLDAAGDIVISDVAENIAENFDALNEDWHVESLTLTDNAPLALTVAQALRDNSARAAITNMGYTIAVTDTAADVSNSFDALNADTHVASITLTDAGTPTLTLTAMQAIYDWTALGKITNGGYAVAIVDTAAHVVDNYDALKTDANVRSITLSGTPTLVLTATEAVNDQAILGEITNSNYSITVVGTGADVSPSFDALNGDARVTSIFLAGQEPPTLTLTAAQALDDTTALGEISVPYAVAVSDTAANVAARFDALNSDGHLASITLTDSGVPTLVLTAAQVQNDANALSKITNANYVLSIVSSATPPTLTMQNASGSEDQPIALSISPTETDPNGTLSLTISGVPADAILSNSQGAISVTNGSIAFTSAQLAAGVLTELAVTPTSVDEPSFALHVTATTTDGTSTLSTSQDLSVTVSPHADTPSLTAQNASGTEGQPIALSIGAALLESGAADPDAALSLTISDIPAGASLSNSQGALNVSNGSITFTSPQLAAGALTGLAITPANDANFALTVTATAQDGTSATSTAQTIQVTVAPLTPTLTISGTAQEGQTLTANAVTTDADVTIAYQWQSSSDGQTWVNISGATGSTYAVAEGDEALQLRVTASATDSEGNSTSATSAATAAVIDIPPTLSVTVSGTAQEGQTLSATAVTNDADAVVTYQWQSFNGTSWSNIAGATAATYTATEADEGNQLRVIATSTDADGSGTTATSAATSAVVDVTPTLSVTVTGTAQEGQTLTATAVANDSDAIVIYQWQSLSGSIWSNISGATGSSYGVTEADEGHQLRVIATSTDSDGGGTSATSGATAAIVDIAPTLSVTISGTAQEGQTLMAAPVANDSDAVITYQWQSLSGTTWSNIAGSTGAIYQVAEADESHLLRVIATSTDSDGSGASATSAATAAVVDIAPTLSVTISGTAQQGQTLTATAVANDSDAVVKYQWQSLSGTTWSNISGATAATHLVTEANENHQLRVVATSTDSDGNGIATTSAPTASVVDVPPSLTVSISGTAAEGSALTASPQVTGDSDGGTTTYQWQTFSGTTWTDIAGATKAKYTPTEADEGNNLRVVATFVDDTGQSVAATSSPTSPVVDITPTLTVKVTGTAQEGKKLTASATANDSDAVVTYQWQSFNGTTWSDVAGATTSTYEVGETDEGNQLRVVAMSSDSDGSGTTTTSAATTAVIDITPTLSVKITGTAKEGQTLTATATANDADAVVTYQWQSLTGITWSGISGATGATYAVGEGDEGHQLRVIATSSDSDGSGTSATSAATAAVTDIAATLSVTVNGTAQEGQTLTAVAVANDSDATIAYRWQQSANGTTWSNIAGATAATYTVAEANEGHQLRVIATSSDSDGGTSATSAATAAVTDAPPTLTISNQAITVAAGGSIALPISVSPFDSDDTLTVTITGLTNYETVTDNHDSTVFSGSSITLTSAEVSSGLTLHSSYTGTDHPVNTLTVTANNTTRGEAVSSAPQTITVTDPPLTVDPTPVMWSSHDPVTTGNGTGWIPDIIWGRTGSPFEIGTIANGIAWPSGTLWGALNPNGSGAASGPRSLPSGVLWTAMDPVGPTPGAGGGGPPSGILHLSDPAGAGVADGSLMPAAWTSAHQHLVFGLT
jgi:hypothetical protein